MRAFNLKEALAGKPVITRDGYKVLDIYLTKIKCTRPISVLIDAKDSIIEWMSYREDGKNSKNENDPWDLCMADEEEEKIELKATANELPRILHRTEPPVSSYIKKLEARLEELEKSVEELKIKSAHKSNHLLNRIEDLEDEMQRQRKQINILTSIVEKLEGKQIQEKEPHKCPICGGEGKYFTLKYLHSFEFGAVQRDQSGRPYIMCKTCQGKGILWG